jgi:hypothetical protein
MPRASSVSCNLELKTISDCLVWSISLRPLQSLPLAKRFEAFISSWHNSVRHRAACSSVNLTSPSILEAPFGKGDPCQAAIFLHPTGSTDRAHKVNAQSLPWPPSFVTLLLRVVVATLVPLAGATVYGVFHRGLIAPRDASESGGEKGRGNSDQAITLQKGCVTSFQICPSKIPHAPSVPDPCYSAGCERRF